MVDVLKIGGTFQNSKRCRKDLLLALVLRDGLVCSNGWVFFREGFLRRGWWKSRASSRSDFSAAHIICNKTQCLQRKGEGYVSMYECAKLRDWGLTHPPFSSTQFFSHYTCAWWNLTQEIQMKNKKCRKEIDFAYGTNSRFLYCKLRNVRLCRRLFVVISNNGWEARMKNGFLYAIAFETFFAF